MAPTFIATMAYNKTVNIAPLGRISTCWNAALSLAQKSHLDHGYAMTSHSSQGQTADRVLIHVDTELSAKDLLTVAWPTFLCRVHAATGSLTNDGETLNSPRVRTGPQETYDAK